VFETILKDEKLALEVGDKEPIYIIFAHLHELKI